MELNISSSGSVMSQRRNERFVRATLFVLTLGALALIYFVPSRLFFDQDFVKYRFSWSRFPSFEEGIVSYLFVGIYNRLISPPVEQLNAHIKMLALIMYVTSSYLMARALLKEQKSLCLFTIIIFSSALPFLWLSSELFAGALMALIMLGFVSGWRPFLLCLVIAVFGHVKPDLILISLAFMLYLLFTRCSGIAKRLMLLGAYVLLNALLIFPGLLLNGFQFKVDRSFNSIAQHYGYLVEPHQIMPNAPGGFADGAAYMKAVFPKATNVKELVLNYPKKYYDYVILSLGHGFKRVLRLFHVFLLFIPFIYQSAKRGTYRLEIIDKLFLISLIGFVPLILFSFPTIRYMARYYPVAILIVLSYVEKMKQKGASGFLMEGLVWSGIMMNCFLFYHASFQWSTGVFWYPD